MGWSIYLWDPLYAVHAAPDWAGSLISSGGDYAAMKRIRCCC